ncbi:MAG: hypothetical protein V2A78_05370 [bacterium]
MKKKTVVLVLAKIVIFLALMGLFLLGYLWPEYQSRFSIDGHQIQLLIMILIGFFLFIQSMDSRLSRGWIIFLKFCCAVIWLETICMSELFQSLMKSIWR